MMNRRNFIETMITLGAVTGIAPGFLPRPTQPAVLRTGYLGEVRAEVLAWLETVRYTPDGWGRWKYNRHMYRKYGLESGGQAINTLLMLDALKDVPDRQKGEAIAFFESCRDPEDGYMKDPLVGEKDKVSDHHSWEHIWAHMDGVAQSALRNLGKPVPERKAAPFVDIRKVDPENWLLSLEWSNPWLVGEHMTRVVKWYWNQLPEAERTADEPVLQKLFTTYEKHILDPATGMPVKRGCTSRERAMAGAFKIFGSYLATGRKIPYPERALDFVLNLQRPDGSFGESDAPVPMTINWDSLYDLRVLNTEMGGAYRFKDVQDAGNRCARFLLKAQRKSDGGFSQERNHCQTVHNSIRISDKHPESDTNGTNMSLRCLSYADEWNAGG